jgi:hypothetical protein
MAVTNPGDPINTLRNALDAYTAVQQTMIEEAHKLKADTAFNPPGSAVVPEGGATNGVPAGS